MNRCVGMKWSPADKKSIPCGAECEPGFKYCPEHKDRPRAVKDREKTVLNDFAAKVNPLTTSPIQEPEIQDAELVDINETPSAKEIAKANDAPTIYDRVADILNKTQKFADDAERNYTSLRPEELRYFDKAGAEQLRSEVVVYERALDRQIRALTQVAKLDIEAQAININNVIRELIQETVMRVFYRMNLTPEQTKQARIYLAEEFAKLDKG